MAKLSKDLSAGSLHPRENIVGSALFAATNAELVIATDGAASVVLDMRGSFSLSIQVEGSVDGANWALIPIRQHVGPTSNSPVQYMASPSSGTSGAYIGSCAGFRLVRARCTAFTSGTCSVTLLASLAAPDQSIVGQTTPFLVTAVGTAGAALTLTLPAPPGGLRHYLSFLQVNRFAAALLTAAATPVTVTTTNLPGSLAYSFEADAAAQGTMVRQREDFQFPLSATTQATATTIVCPATTGVIWRATAGYFLER